MILNNFSDVSRALAAIHRRLAAIEAQLRTRVEPDGAAIDEMIACALNGLEKAMAADMGFEDEDQAAPVRAVSPRR